MGADGLSPGGGTMRIRAGKSGWSYPEWKGHFYPDKLPAKQMLRFYATKFRTVEVNNTFYRMPAASVFEGWAAEVPDDFQFVIKASRRITHDKRLQDVADPVAFLFASADALGGKLGPFLFQLPPFVKKDLPRLEAFLELVPPARRVALEFRHASWFEDDVFAALRARNAALCIADTGEADDAPFVPTADWGYLRLRRVAYAEGEVEGWADRVQAAPWTDAFVFFKHEDEGTGPRLAAQFLERLAAPA